MTLFRKLYSFWDNVEKYGRARQPTDDDKTQYMLIACYMTKATDNTVGIWNTYCFPTATIGTPTHPSVTYTYLHCLSCK